MTAYETPKYRCNCGQEFPSHLARAAHAGGCPRMPCRSVYPPSADAPHEGSGWSGPLRCVLSAAHEGDFHWNTGIRWADPVTSQAWVASDDSGASA